MKPETVAAIFVTLCFLVIGVSCTFWPKRVMYFMEGSLWDIWRDIKPPIDIKVRLFYIEMAGAMALGGFILCILALFLKF